MESLEIQNFLTIREACLDVKRLNIIIRPQATGKSVIAKLLFFFQDFLNSDLINFIRNSASKRDIERKTLSFFEVIFPKNTWNGQKFLITYTVNKAQITIKHERNSKGSFILNFNYSQELEELRKKVKNVLKRKQQEYQNEELEQIFSTSNISNKDFLFHQEISNYIFESDLGINFRNPIFIPASRSFFANIQKNIFSFLANNIEIEYFISQFGSVYERTRRLYELLENDQIELSSQNKKLRLTMKNLVEKVLFGKYIYENDEDWIYSLGRKISLVNASSGQQESLPMLLVLSVFPVVSKRQTMFFIEEPEAHLFPFAQKYIANLFSLVYNKTQSSFLITTHSPYILTAFNNMIMASNIYKSSGEETRDKLSKIVQLDNFINYDDITAYTIKDGFLKSILDKEVQLIGSSIIDSVSDEFNMKFDEIIELQLENYK